MASCLSHPSLSPIDKLPYDALREIFTHCVPTYPNILNHRFETTPLTLSRVCSSWRVVVYTSPRLWCYLSQMVAAQYRHGRWMVLKRHIDLMRWWRSKHGIIFPIIHMRVRSPYSFEEGHLVDEDAFSFILEYLASAQYLDVNTIIWDELATRKITCPNLSTVILHSDRCNSEDEVTVSHLLSVMRLTATPPLRRLSMLNFKLSPENVLLSLDAWSLLTHVALWNIVIPLHFWFDFVRTVPALRWAYLSIYRIEGNYENLIEYSLPQLCSLFIESVDAHICDLLSNLYLPTLHTLSLSLRRAWSQDIPQDVIAKLPNLLKTAPSITTLGLSETFLPTKDDSDDSEMGWSPSTPEPSLGTTPFWTHTPQLTHFFLETFVRTDIDEIVERIVLHRLNCPIRKLTVVTENLWDATEDITESKYLVVYEPGSERERSICVDFDIETLDEKAWDASTTWDLVD
ncbi:hypothetical protein BDN70DRAFT_886428 [Pholiota conissans]|uniref:F-box domain-containing protein n=1 Tax=Pholiota conissans TaxID=109636 RepID=A0A9P5YPC3_9AGAR|nr:hypothetical protein BDN70DRAFT_886428 [Pholiota conissans]